MSEDIEQAKMVAASVKTALEDVRTAREWACVFGAFAVAARLDKAVASLEVATEATACIVGPLTMPVAPSKERNRGDREAGHDL